MVDKQQPPSEAPRGAPPGRDPDYELHEEVGEEAKRLATQPVDETQRLGNELASGRSEATPLLAMSALTVGIAVLVAIVIALVVIAIYLT